MHMLYNSDTYAVVHFDVPAGADAAEGAPGRGGYEIVDKFSRKEIFIQGELARSFKAGVDALIESQPSEEEVDAYLERYAAMMQQPLVLH
jgi:hypothetical protein